ncbi:MAG: hypothetical protein LBT40_08740 [Deltaproteobacteria bacterium]|jgi:hypothetical protein|nr:hypothetical protein [Deltaproteobacteria bacterium]
MAVRRPVGSGSGSSAISSHRGVQVRRDLAVLPAASINAFFSFSFSRFFCLSVSAFSTSLTGDYPSFRLFFLRFRLFFLRFRIFLDISNYYCFQF